MITLVLETFLLGLPFSISNSFAVLSMSIPFYKDWTTPIDFGLEIGGKRLLGKGKTFRGFLFGTLCGTLITFVQYPLLQKLDLNFIKELQEFSFEKLLVFNFLLSFGALFGDMFKSLIKRRMGVKSGQPWVPFDQLDFLIGAILFGSILYTPPWQTLAVILIGGPLGHLLTNILGYKLKLKDVWW